MDANPTVSSETPVASPQPQEQVTQTPAPEVKGIPYDRFHAVNEEKKALENRVKELEDTLTRSTPSDTDEVFSDEGRALKSQIDSLQDQIAMRDTLDKFPQLRGNQADFEEFRKEFPRHKMENVAKLFLVEKGLLATDEPRKGLEPVNGGGRQTPQPGVNADELANLRVNNPREYEKRLLSGSIRLDDIK